VPTEAVVIKSCVLSGVCISKVEGVTNVKLLYSREEKNRVIFQGIKHKIGDGVSE